MEIDHFWHDGAKNAGFKLIWQRKEIDTFGFFLFGGCEELSWISLPAEMGLFFVLLFVDCRVVAPLFVHVSVNYLGVYRNCRRCDTRACACYLSAIGDITCAWTSPSGRAATEPARCNKPRHPTDILKADELARTFR